MMLFTGIKLGTACTSCNSLLALIKFTAIDTCLYIGLCFVVDEFDNSYACLQFLLIKYKIRYLPIMCLVVGVK